MTKQRTKPNTALWVVLASALALRLVLALVTEGYPYDMSCFVAWGDKLAAQGPAAFYSEGYFADYPPGYLWVLGLVGVVRAALGIAYESRWTYLLLALVPSVCDCVSAALVYAVARRGTVGRQMALVLAAFTAFDPLLLFDTAVWKQIDGAFTLPLLLCFLLLEQRRYLPAAVWFGLALAIKPQALLFGPVLAACFLAGIAVEQDRLRAFGRCFGGAALALLAPLLTGIPFFGLAQLGPRLVEKYTATMSGYPYASINAFNWLAALGGNWKSLSEPALFGMSWQQLGWVHILLVTAGLAYFAVCSSRSGRFSPLLLAAYYGIGVFTLSHCMHERYMVPGVLLTLLAAARWNDIRLYAAGVGLSLTGFINLAAVYSLTGTEDEWLTSATSATVAILTGLGETVCFVLLLFAVWDITRHGHTLALPAGRVNATATPDAQPAWTRREVGALLALTAATAVLSFAYLGSRTAPQQPLDATNTALTETVTLQRDAVSLWVYPGVSFGGRMTVTDAQGNTVFEKELDYGTCFSWTANTVTAAAGQSLTVTVQNAQMFELAFRDAAGGLVPTVGGGNGRGAAGARLYALFPEPPCHDRHLRHLFYPAGRVLHGVVLPAGADRRRAACPAADGAGRHRLRAGLRSQVDRHLCGGRAGSALSGRALGAPAAEPPRLLGRVPYGGAGRGTVLCGAAPLHLCGVLPAVLVAAAGFQPRRLVAVPAFDVQLPRHAQGNAPV